MGFLSPFSDDIQWPGGNSESLVPSTWSETLFAQGTISVVYVPACLWGSFPPFQVHVRAAWQQSQVVDSLGSGVHSAVSFCDLVVVVSVRDAFHIRYHQCSVRTCLPMGFLLPFPDECRVVWWHVDSRARFAVAWAC